jgi:hypothetical protein
MKRQLAIVACTLVVLAGSALAQQPQKPSAALKPLDNTQPPARRGLERRAPIPALLPTGTALRIRLERPISTNKSRMGSKFAGSITEAVLVEGQVMVPAGAHVTGRVEHKAEPRRVHGHPSLRLHPEKLMFPDGQVFAMDASIVDSGNPGRVKVNERGDITGPSISRGQKVETIALTGAGAATGAIVAGPVGAVAGAAAGAGASAGHYMMRRSTLELPAGTVLILELNAPINLARTELARSRDAR